MQIDLGTARTEWNKRTRNLAENASYLERIESLGMGVLPREPFFEPKAIFTAPPLVRTSPTGKVGIALVLMEEFDLYDLGALSECFELYNSLSGDSLFQLSLVCIANVEVRSSSGVSISTTRSIDHLHPRDNVFLLGATPRGKLSQRVRQFVKTRLRLPGSITSIGEACHIFAAMDLLHSVPIAAHWGNAESIQKSFPASNVVNTLATVEGKIMTCCGHAATLDFALHCIASAGDDGIARRVGFHLGHREARELNHSQRLSLPVDVDTYPDAVRKAAQIMSANIANPIAIGEVARLTGTGVRQLQRIFLRHFGETPIRMYVNYRLRCARRLVQRTSLPISYIGELTGFLTPSNFSKRYRRAFRTFPMHDRQMFVATRNQDRNREKTRSRH